MMIILVLALSSSDVITIGILCAFDSVDYGGGGGRQSLASAGVVLEAKPQNPNP